MPGQVRNHPMEVSAPAAVSSLDLASRLEAAVAALREKDEFLPIHVLVATPILGTWLGRAIFPATGHFAIHFERPEQLAWRLVEPAALQEGLRPVPEFADLAMVLAAVREEGQREDLPEYLKTALRTRGFAPAALRTLHDLDGAGIGPDALDRLAPSSAAPERLQLLARVQRSVNNRLEAARLLPRATLLRRAAQGPAQSDIGAVVVCPFDDPSVALETFLAALAESYPLVRLDRISAKRKTPDKALQRLQSGLFDDEAAPPKRGKAPMASTLPSASSPPQASISKPSKSQE